MTAPGENDGRASFDHKMLGPETLVLGRRYLIDFDDCCTGGLVFDRFVGIEDGHWSEQGEPGYWAVFENSRFRTDGIEVREVE